MVTKKKVFNGKTDLDLINMLLKLPLEERKKEVQHCDLASLARTMESFPNWQVEEIAAALPSKVRAEFIRVVKMYKGEVAVPRKTRPTKVKKKKSKVGLMLFLSVLLGFLVVVIDHWMPH